MTGEELTQRVTALEKRMDILEAFHVRLWNGQPTILSTVSCGRGEGADPKEIESLIPTLNRSLECPAPLHGYSMLHNVIYHDPFLGGDTSLKICEFINFEDLHATYCGKPAVVAMVYGTKRVPICEEHRKLLKGIRGYE